MEKIFFKLKRNGDNWTIAFMDLSNKITLIDNNREELIQFIKDNNDKLFLGINSFMGEDKEITSLIKNGDLDGEVSNEDVVNYFPKTMDLSQGIVRNNLIDFDKIKCAILEPGEKLVDNIDAYNNEEKGLITDLHLMKKIYNMDERQKFVDWKIKVINDYNLDDSAYRFSFSDIMIQILGLTPEDKDALGKNFVLDSKLEELLKEENSKFLFDTLEKVKNYYANCGDEETEKVSIDVDECHVRLNEQGILGSIDEDYFDNTGKGTYLYIDFNSFGPNILLNNNWLRDNATNPERLSEVKDTRIDLKAKKETEQLFYKYILNASLNCLRGVYVDGDKNVGISLAVSGIMTMLLLYEKLKKYNLKLIECNTDGLIVKCPDKKCVKDIQNEVKKFADSLNLSCDVDVVNKIIHFDEKNYVMQFDGKDAKVKHLGCFGAFQESILNCSGCYAVEEALREYYLNNVPIAKTLSKLLLDNNLEAFQVVNKTTKAQETVLGDNLWKYNRWYAVKNREGKYIGYSAKRTRTVKDGYYFFAFANEQRPDIRDLDINYYVDLCYKTIEKHCPKDEKLAANIIVGAKKSESGFVDADGTLVREMSEELKKDIYGKACQRYIDDTNFENTYTSFDWLLLQFLGVCKKYKAYGTIDNFASFLKDRQFISDKLNIEDYKAIVTNYLNLEQEAAPSLGVYDDSARLLEFLKEQGYKLYLYSNWFGCVQDSKLQAAGLSGYFDGVYTIDNAYAKSSVNGWYDILSTTGTNRDYFNAMIGNGSSDMVPKIIGMPTYIVNHDGKELAATVTENGIVVPNFDFLIADGGRYFYDTMYDYKSRVKDYKPSVKVKKLGSKFK